MYFDQVKEINRSLKKTGKAIISLGCSFVEGQGAIDQELYNNYEWTMQRTGVPMQPVLSKKQSIQLKRKYPELESDGKNINFTFMEYKNAFVNVLCKKYFKNEYTPINMGIRGRGNRASIKNLYLWPDIRWDLAKEIIVLYVPSGKERFDFVNDEFNEHNLFSTAWPHWKDQHAGARKNLWKGYSEAVYSDKSSVLEQILNVMDLQNWCKVNNAKLVITPGFDRTYTKESFNMSLKDYIERNTDQNIVAIKTRDSGPESEELLKFNRHEGHLETLEKIVDQWPWDNMFYPQDCQTFMDLCLKQEGIVNKGFWDYNGVGTPGNWVTVCCHPSAKAHDLFAKELYEHIRDM